MQKLLGNLDISWCDILIGYEKPDELGNFPKDFITLASCPLGTLNLKNYFFGYISMPEIFFELMICIPT